MFLTCPENIWKIFIVIAILNVAKIYLQYLVHKEIKKDEAAMREEMANRQVAFTNSVQPSLY